MHHQPGHDRDKKGRKGIDHLGRRLTIHEDSDHFDLLIDGVALHHLVSRLGPHRYHSDMLPFVEYRSAAALGKALIETEGTLWKLEKPHHPGDHGEADPSDRK